MKYILFFLCLGIGALSAREFDVGILLDTRDPAYAEKKSYQKLADEYKNKLTAMKLKIKEVNADIFLPANQAEAAKYKRIFIPFWHMVFPLQAYDGMNEYVRGGGLILTDSILSGIDTDGDFKMDYTTSLKKKQKKPDHPRQGFHAPTGVVAHSTVEVKNITSLAQCPVTLGLTSGETTPMNFKMRQVTNHRATVVVTGDGVRKDQEFKAMPVVTFLHEGKGAFLYIPVNVELFFKNAFSEETLDWLCDQ